MLLYTYYSKLCELYETRTLLALWVLCGGFLSLASQSSGLGGRVREEGEANMGKMGEESDYVEVLVIWHGCLISMPHVCVRHP